MLDAAEDASPVSAVEAVTRELGVALGATSVSFLIADLSGRALVRLAHVALDGGPAAGVRRDDDRPARAPGIGRQRLQPIAGREPHRATVEGDAVNARDVRERPVLANHLGLGLRCAGAPGHT